MNVGFMGLGKLGLPCALAVESKGHQVVGYDINPEVKKILDTKVLPYREEGAHELLVHSEIEFVDVPGLVSKSDIIFVPIQTPHAPMYEGITRLPEIRTDFDYSHLIKGVRTLSDEIDRQGEDKIVIIISTVLPGTIRREIKPWLSSKIKLCYNPFFIAMGTTIRDFTNPEFVLFGKDDDEALREATALYATIHDKPVYACTIEEAEMIKVTYNTFITMKVNLANLVMELSHKLDNVDCDNVMRALFLATDRIISSKYLLGGMGDGGHCHPRDCIALSWLARTLDASFDWYESLMLCREKQTEWLAQMIVHEVDERNLDPVILGVTFKKESNLIGGSAVILLKNLLSEYLPEEVRTFDPWVDAGKPPLDEPAIFFIGMNHDEFLSYKYPEGSVIIDPWGMYKREQPGTELISIGRRLDD